uniref:Neurotensin receptor 1 (high affinity) n=1 Tax=Hucho hucho TaxID=62062 RepID=A0A4W5LST8_9TELE
MLSTLLHPAPHVLLRRVYRFLTALPLWCTLTLLRETFYLPPQLCLRQSLEKEGYDYYHYFFMVTNVLFYVSSAVNPVLYNLVSANYREIFFNTLRCFCVPCRRKKQRRVLIRHSTSISSNHTFSSNIVKETVY